MAAPGVLAVGELILVRVSFQTLIILFQFGWQNGNSLARVVVRLGAVSAILAGVSRGRTTG